MVVGIIGALFILVAWIIEMRRGIRKDAKNADERLILIYLIGGILLAYYATQTNDFVFAMLSVVITILALIEFAIIFAKKH